MGAGLDGRVAEPAIDSHSRDMMLMAEGHGLIDDPPHLALIARPSGDWPQQYHADQEEGAACKDELRDGIH